MKKSKILYAVFLFLVTLSAALAAWAYHIKEGADLLNFTVSITGFCISALALFIAVRTYTSIDSVNNINKMEGNILDNENYVTSLPELITTFKSKESRDLYAELFKSIEKKLKNESSTAAMLADTLQHMIDLIVLLPAVFNASDAEKDSYKTHIKKILKQTEKRCEILHSINKGSSIQITETIKLFKAVIRYQDLVADGNFNIHADLLHVRGPILKNPVTRTVYHNYLGLYHNKKGMHLLRKALSIGNIDTLSIKGLALVKKHAQTIDPSILEEIEMHLRSACNQFDKALKISEEDMMWPGFITYNKARTLYFLHILSNTENTWLASLDEAIEFRARVNRLIDETLTTSQVDEESVEDTHLRQFFRYQEELARIIRLNITISENNTEKGKHLILYRGGEITPTSRINFENTPRFSQVKSYQEDIIQALNSMNAASTH